MLQLSVSWIRWQIAIGECNIILPTNVYYELSPIIQRNHHASYKYIRHCFWRGKGLDKKNPPSAVWELICRSKSKWGLGILNLQVQNNSLLLKMVHKFLNHKNIPWVHIIWEAYYKQGFSNSQLNHCSFWWRDRLKLMLVYKDLAVCNPQNGHNALF